jgi:hypothetical protein
MLHELEPYLPELTPLMFGVALFLIGLLLLPGERAASKAQKEQRDAENRRTAA